MIEELLLIQILNISVPFVSGAFLAMVGLVNKYPTEMKYVYRSLSTWLYILISAGGSLLFTLLMGAVGARLVDNPLLNSISFGIIGPGVFLGIVSKLPYPKPSTSNIEDQLHTLRDYIYNILDKSISRKTIQIVELKIRDAGRYFDPENLLREVGYMLEPLSELTEKQKDDLLIRFDEHITLEDYGPVIRELKKYYDFDYIIKRLSHENDQKYVRRRLRSLIQLSLDTHGLHNSVLPEFVIAKVQALQKDADMSLYYLEQALKKKPSLKRHILTNEVDWWILTSMTHGEKQHDKLIWLMNIIDIEPIAIDTIKQQCTTNQYKHSVTLMAVKRKNGDCVKITIKGTHKSQTTPNIWWIMCEGDQHLDKKCTNIEEVMTHIEKIAIPLRSV